GELIEAFLNENGEIEIAESTFIPVQLKHQTQKSDESKFYCDVITKDGLEDYASKLDNWIDDIIKEKL
ncbi:MAG: hypothetical protein R3213_10880, partial [Flavobacteriaceae bacterium]|nr:hypothetical protein [Flavobacteriaceae bacterium]